MSTAGGPGGAAGGGKRVVISSVTGEAIPWGEQDPGDRRGTSRERSGEDAPIPHRAAEDVPAPGTDESNDERIARDVPPHWGRGD